MAIQPARSDADGGPQAAQQQKTEAPAQETAQQTGEVHGLEAPIAEKPILMTSAGQSADVQMLYAVAQKSGLEAEVRAVAEADQLDADAYKTLIIAVGGSSKGLGAAGIDADEEKVRVQKIIDKFKDSTTIIGRAYRRRSAPRRAERRVYQSGAALCAVYHGGQRRR